jgi:hypothetical protein
MKTKAYIVVLELPDDLDKEAVDLISEIWKCGKNRMYTASKDAVAIKCTKLVLQSVEEMPE